MAMIHENTCPAFFLDATTNSAGNYSPCTALGGGVFVFKYPSFRLIWDDPVLEDVRQRSIAGEKLPMCNRCWSEEQLGFTSERQYLIKDLPNGLNYTDPAYYKQGPRHLNIKVSNICNLRCRTCQSYDSYLYHIEGEYYQKTYGLGNTPYTANKAKQSFTDEQLDHLFDFSKNLERIELYGGEPFLDDQIPKYLTRLINEGMSKYIDLSVSTNLTHRLSDTWRNILCNFKNVIVNASIDGIGDKFTYMRHPGNWDAAVNTLKDLFALQTENQYISIQPVVTVSALNVWDVPEIFAYFQDYGVTPFIILVQWPSYYCVNVLPHSVQPIVAHHLEQYGNPEFNSIISLMKTTPKTFREGSATSPWEEFKFWTRAKDSYRNEDFLTTFKEIGSVLIEKNEW